jgi:hypothetical protein
MGRPKADVAAQPRELLRLGAWLGEWRKSHDRGVALPEKFWVSAGRVARQHGVHATARALRLEYNKLKRASAVEAGAGGRGKGTRVQDPVKFIELTGALPRSPGECRLTLTGENGKRLQMEMAPGAAAEVLLQLCRSGWSAS